ncbi:MAG: 50S ribosomal protein L9 [Candidatus Cloacimonetes bacterium]|jgi:large subunit ribosomal protein L9|nr:50S ribosomal protein L9 [Candidatus Cloacimonadota bacterium]
MKVILLNHIEKLGKKGEVVSVKRGFARNYLIPRKLAIYATPQNMKHLSAIQNQAAEEEEKLIEELKKLDAKIRTLSLVFVRKVDEHDSMFGSVSEIDIVNELAAQDVNIHKSAVLMEKNIKSLGETVVQIRLHKDIVSELKVLVEKEARDEAVEEQVAAPAVDESTPVEPEIPAEPDAVAEVVETEEPKPTEDEI